jgi:hypothetical protein
MMQLQQGFATGEMGFQVSLRRNAPEPLMPALRQMQTFSELWAMSALPPKADITDAMRNAALCH